MKQIKWRPLALGSVALMAMVFAVYSLAHQTMIPITREIDNAKRVALPRRPERSAAGPGLIAGNGLVEPNAEETRVASAVAGRVSVVLVTEGQHVKKDELLMEFDHALEDAVLAAADAEVEVAQGELTRVMHGMRSQEIVAISSEATAAKSRRDLADSELHRTEELAKSGSMAPVELDRARKSFEAERASFNAASARASAARSGSRYEDILIGNAHLKATRARRDEAAAALARMVIRAPLAGEVLRVKFRVSEYYSPAANQPLILLGDTSKLKVRLDIDERDVASVKVGAKTYITSTAFGDARFAGKVASVGRRMGRRTVRTDDPVDRIDVKILEVVVDIDDSSRLIPGLRVTGFVESTPP